MLAIARPGIQWPGFMLCAIAFLNVFFLSTVLPSSVVGWFLFLSLPGLWSYLFLKRQDLGISWNWKVDDKVWITG